MKAKSRSSQSSAASGDKLPTYCFDIDGTLCTNTEGDYENAKPFPKIIARVNALRKQGHKIILQTARGTATGIDWRPTTERQMREWGVEYDGLYFGKPSAQIYVDDKAINVRDWIEKEKISA